MDPRLKSTDAPTGLPASPKRAPVALADLLVRLFQAWTQAEIPFLILRNYQDLPASTSNDVDVLLSPEQMRQAEQVLLSAARSAGYHLHNRIEFASLGLFLYHPESAHQIQIDLFSKVAWRGFTVLSADTMLKARIARGSFSIPEPVHEAASSLLDRLLQHGRVGDKYKPTILAAFAANPEKAKAVLVAPFGRGLAEAVVGRALEQNWAAVEQLTKALRRALIRRSFSHRPCRTTLSLLSDAVRLLRRWFAPGGMTIVVLGADGSGKSTVGTQAMEHLRATFPPGKGLQVHWKPVVFFRHRRQPTGRPTVDPHGQQARNRIASLAYLAGHWLEFFLGSHLQFRPVLFRGGLVLIDRYYYDFFVDQRRYRLQVPHWVVRAMFALLRQPDLVFLLDAPAAVLQSRKQEVPPAETARQVEAYRQLVARLPQGRVLDATQPAEHVAAHLTLQVLGWLEQRANRRGRGGAQN